MMEASSRQFPLRHLFWLTAAVALALGLWLPDVSKLSQRSEMAAILLLLARVAVGWITLFALGRYVRLMPRRLRRWPLELQVLAGLVVLLVLLIAAAILLPPAP